VALSPKTLGVLLEIAVYGAPEGVKGLSKELGVGRVQIDSALAELASIGLVRLSNGKTAKGTFWYKVELTPEGVAYAHNWMTGKKPLAVLPNGETNIYISLNSNIADTYIADIPYSKEQYGLYANSVNKSAEQSSALNGKENIGGIMSLGSTPIDPDDLADEMKKDKERKKQERKEQSENHYRDRQRIRSSRAVVDWSPADVVNHFSEQVKLIWNVENVALTQRPKLVRAMDLFRMDNDTNGEIDKYLIDAYISTKKFDKTKLYNPEEIFWGFINWAPTKVGEAKRSVKAEDLDAVAVARAKNRKLLGLD
jgi:hypothetical protein